MILAADFGGTHVRLAIVVAGSVKARAVLDSPATEEPAESLPKLHREATAMAAGVGLALNDLAGMVWALPLIIDPGLRRALRGFGKFDGTTAPDFCPLAEEHFGLPLLLEGDGRTAAIGGWQAGAGRGADDLVMITLGTGTTRSLAEIQRCHNS